MRELGVAPGDASEILEPAETTLDGVAVFLLLFGVPDTFFAVGFARDDRLDLGVFEEGSERIGGITSRAKRIKCPWIARRAVEGVGQKFLDAGRSGLCEQRPRRDRADAVLRHDTIGGVAMWQDQHPRPSIRIDDHVASGRQSASGPSINSATVL